MQGVGYRDALHAEALRLGVRGWVRNRADGSVEALLQGSAEAVETLVAWAHRGPAAARVLEVLVEDPLAEFRRPFEGFERWPSA